MCSLNYSSCWRASSSGSCDWYNIHQTMQIKLVHHHVACCMTFMTFGQCPKFSSIETYMAHMFWCKLLNPHYGGISDRRNRSAADVYARGLHRPPPHPRKATEATEVMGDASWWYSSKKNIRKFLKLSFLSCLKIFVLTSGSPDCREITVNQ